MFSAANKYGWESTRAPRAAVERACALLDTALTTSGEDTHAVATQFERLARKVQTVLDFTFEIVDCIQQDWVASIVPTAQALALSARNFIEDRIRSLAAISGGFTNEAQLLEKVLALTKEQRSIAREGWALRVLASIEVARLGGTGCRLEYMARELDEFSAMVSAGASEIQTEAEQRRTTLFERRRKLNLALQYRTEHFTSIEAQLSNSIGSMNTALLDFARITTDFQQCLALISRNIAEVVEAIQRQDITRQQTEHVRDILIQTSNEFEIRNGRNSDPRLDMILKVQAFQIQNARRSTKEWIEQVHQCLDGILRVGSSDVLTIGAKILEQERVLSSQLSHFECLEQECAADDVEIEASLAGIGEIMCLTRTYLNRSELARDRMQLLNFNCMVEACNLGDAAALLEITRNIGHISTGWSALTDRSSETLDAMLSSSVNAEQAHRIRTRLGMEDLGKARSDSNESLVALSMAAAIADCNGGKVKTAVMAMQDESTILGNTAERLAKSVALLEEAENELRNAEGVSLNAEKLTDEARLGIETECAVRYSSELERHILHAVLHGEPLPEVSLAVRGNEIELF